MTARFCSGPAQRAESPPGKKKAAPAKDAAGFLKLAESDTSTITTQEPARANLCGASFTSTRQRSRRFSPPAPTARLNLRRIARAEKGGAV